MPHPAGADDVRCPGKRPDIFGTRRRPDVTHDRFGMLPHPDFVLAVSVVNTRFGQATGIQLVRQFEVIMVVRQAIAQDIDARHVVVAAHSLDEGLPPQATSTGHLFGVGDGHHTDGLQQVPPRKIG